MKNDVRDYRVMKLYDFERAVSNFAEREFKPFFDQSLYNKLVEASAIFASVRDEYIKCDDVCIPSKNGCKCPHNQNLCDICDYLYLCYPVDDDC